MVVEERGKRREKRASVKRVMLSAGPSLLSTPMAVVGRDEGKKERKSIAADSSLGW